MYAEPALTVGRVSTLPKAPGLRGPQASKIGAYRNVQKQNIMFQKHFLYSYIG